MKRLLAFVALLFCAAVHAQGFVAQSGKLYRAPVEFRMRGVNYLHWDQVPAGTASTGANAARIAVNLSQPPAAAWARVKAIALDNGVVPIVGSWDATCKTDAASLSAIVDKWVANASTWTQINTLGVVNIANEWGPNNSPLWRDSYITAVQRMRAAGYTGALMIDAGYCGQDVAGVVAYAPAVLAADPLHNIIFDLHVYGSFHYPATASWMQDYAKSMASLKASGLTIFLGEFGPLGVGPSQTQVPVATLIADAEKNGFGWAAWAMDDNNLPNVMCSPTGWFCMLLDTYDRQKLGDGNFTAWGMAVVTQLRALNAR